MQDFRKLVQGVASTADGIKCGFCSIIWIGALKSTFNHIYSDMLMSAKDDKYFITVTHNPINLTTCINQPLKTRNVKKRQKLSHKAMQILSQRHMQTVQMHARMSFRMTVILKSNNWDKGAQGVHLSRYYFLRDRVNIQRARVTGFYTPALEHTQLPQHAVDI